MLRTVARLDGVSFPSLTRLGARWLRGRDAYVPQRKRGQRVTPEAAFCAEIVATCYIEMGILRDDRRATWYDPGKFWSGDYLPDLRRAGASARRSRSVADRAAPQPRGHPRPRPAARSPPTTVNGNGTPASHSPAYACGVAGAADELAPAVGQLAQVAQRGPDPRAGPRSKGASKTTWVSCSQPLPRLASSSARGVEVGRHVEGPLEQGRPR